MTPSRPVSLAPPSGASSGGSEAAPRRALILAGGGMRVAYQAGVLLALEEEGLSFAHMDGTSGGTINLAMLLSGLSPTEMGDRWATLDVTGFASPMPLAEYLKGPNVMAWADADGIVRKVFPHLGIDVARIRAATGVEGTFNVCNFTRKVVESIPHSEIDQDLLVAGISLPIFMPPVLKGKTVYTDAVWIKDANLMEAVRRGADELWLVWCIANTGDYRPGMLNQYVHMIEMSANGVLFEELDRIQELNHRLAAGEVVGGRRRPVVLHVVKPELPIPLDPDLFFGRVTTAALIDMGYADAKRYLRERSPAGIPLTPEATRMTDPGRGITFREVMTGPFALGATDPRRVSANGRAPAELAIHVTVAIDDVDRFIADPDHRGTLSGHIEFPPWGRRIPASTGVFNLFAPTSDPKKKLMVYELGFERDGRPYYLAGRKEVRDDPGLDLWKDTTTLLTTLHEGRDAAGPVVGAGTLSLGMDDLRKLLMTMRGTGGAGLTDRATAIGRFGRFFMGELWDTYRSGAAPG